MIMIINNYKYSHSLRGAMNCPLGRSVLVARRHWCFCLPVQGDLAVLLGPHRTIVADVAGFSRKMSVDDRLIVAHETTNGNGNHLYFYLWTRGADGSARSLGLSRVEEVQVVEKPILICSSCPQTVRLDSSSCPAPRKPD